MSVALRMGLQRDPDVALGTIGTLAVALVVATVAVWAFPLFLWVYRSLSYTYRLTTHRLYRDRGFHPPASDQRCSYSEPRRPP